MPASATTFVASPQEITATKIKLDAEREERGNIEAEEAALDVAIQTAKERYINYQDMLRDVQEEVTALEARIDQLCAKRHRCLQQCKVG